MLLIAMLGGALMVYAPMPGGLASSHAHLENTWTLDTCSSCHAEGGLAQGCLGCHEEIQAQLHDKVGYHHYLLADQKVECRNCHAEHLGNDFALVNEMSWGAQSRHEFEHPHVDFILEGKHTDVSCVDCHEEKLAEPFQLPDFTVREQTFLGLEQKCASCHEDVHAGGLTGSCDACHGQEEFLPAASFDHDQYFPLDGGHEQLECASCHLIPPEQLGHEPLTFPFHKVSGTDCADCHESPHAGRFQDSCSVCHPGSHPRWDASIRAMTVERHALTGFRIESPHSQVRCEQCHAEQLSFDERYPDANAPGYLRGEDTCQGCHEDVHKGQFEAKYDGCLDCHDRQQFHPTQFGQEAHARLYPLTGRHSAAACDTCHKAANEDAARQFVGTSNRCQDCHSDPHGSQFSIELSARDCDACHNTIADTFAIRPFDHAGATGYPLEGAHALTDCKNCHIEKLLLTGARPAAVISYRGTPSTCSSCHKDVHRGQFQENGSTNCSSCHVSFLHWRKLDFDHNSDTRFLLDGAHAAVSCRGCHVPVKLEDGSSVIQYKPLGRECRDCHEVVPGAPPGTIR